jgi:hypothetical protein
MALLFTATFVEGGWPTVFRAPSEQFSTTGQHQPVPLSNTLPPPSYYHHAPASRTSLSGIQITLIIALFFDFVYVSFYPQAVLHD